jgi:hypothetical protein
MQPKNTEYDKFTGLMSKLLEVPHSELKSKLDEEKKRKKRKPKRSSSASPVSSRDGQ